MIAPFESDAMGPLIASTAFDASVIRMSPSSSTRRYPFAEPSASLSRASPTESTASASTSFVTVTSPPEMATSPGIVAASVPPVSVESPAPPVFCDVTVLPDSPSTNIVAPGAFIQFSSSITAIGMA